jgi:hypothetical protein
MVSESFFETARGRMEEERDENIEGRGSQVGRLSPLQRNGEC